MSKQVKDLNISRIKRNLRFVDYKEAEEQKEQEQESNDANEQNVFDGFFTNRTIICGLNKSYNQEQTNKKNVVYLITNEDENIGKLKKKYTS